LGTDQGGHYVLVVDDNNVAQQRRVRTGSLDEPLRIIEDGLTPDDWVIVSGLQRARPGSAVKPLQTTIAATTPIAQPTPLR